MSKEPNGGFIVVVWSQSEKQRYSQETAIGNTGDVGKVCCQRVQELYEDYLTRHYPVLMANLGQKARYHRSFTDSKDGPNANACFALFPGFWHESQAGRFAKKVLNVPFGGVGERTVRNILSKELTPRAAEFKVDPNAIYQQLHHSKDVHDKVYLSGLRNSCNALQLAVYRWG